MKIAILTSGLLPVPAIQGGAVENLIDFYLEYNQSQKLHDITVFSVKNTRFNKVDTTCNHYCYINTQSWLTRLKRKIYSYKYPTFYYHYHIEYFLHEAIKHIKKENYELIILENRPGYAIPISQITKVPIVLHLHADILNNDTLYAKEICEYCTSIITVSNYIKKQIERISKTIHAVTIYNGIDLQQFQYSKYNTTREQFGFNDSDFIIIYTGRISPIKGIKELIQAIQQLKKYDPIKLLIVGSSNFSDIAEDGISREMKELVFDMEDRIKFTGFISYDHIPSLLKIADIGAIPSTCEDAFPLSALENMAVGLPLIVTRSGGIPEAVDENCAIILDKKQNLVSSLANAILNLYQNKEQRKNMSNAALKRSFHFSKEKYAKQFFDELLNCCKNNNAFKD